MELIQAPGLPAPAGHYAQAVAAGGLVFLSGILPSRAELDAGAPFTQQCASVLAQCRQVLDAAGCTLGDVVQCTAYIVDVENWPAFNAVYAEAFGAHKPARAVVPVPALHHGFLVELQVVAEQKRA
jgi:2-iminobutanoate/2-iminopropanoate deaminase